MGMQHGFVYALRPLVAALTRRHVDVVAWLLSQGADPNGDSVMYYGTDATPVALQLLVDAGGDVNRESSGGPPLFHALVCNSEGSVRVLLATASLDFAVLHDYLTPEEFAQDWRRPALAELIAQEVR